MASDEGNWRGILEYLSPAVQLDLTTTHKHTHNVVSYAYFGEWVTQVKCTSGRLGFAWNTLTDATGVSSDIVSTGRESL